MKSLLQLGARLGFLGYLLVLGATVSAQVPQMIHFQGRVTVSGAPFTGAGQFKFALVNGGENASTRASGTPVITSGFLTSVTVGNVGSGYTGVPAVSVSGGGGGGAVVTATVMAGGVVGYTVVNPGSGYTSAPMLEVAEPPPELRLCFLLEEFGGCGTGRWRAGHGGGC